MSAATPEVRGQRPDHTYEDRSVHVRRSTETKASFKTTEFIACSNANDVFRAHQVWLYATIVTVGYLVSRGLAKSGSREPYTEER